MGPVKLPLSVNANSLTQIVDGVFKRKKGLFLKKEKKNS